MTLEADEARLDRLDYYTLLGVARTASPDDVRAAFHRFAQRFHPDVYLGQGEEKIARANLIYRRGTEAYRVLVDPDRRKRYDEQLSIGRLRFDPSAMSPVQQAVRSIPPAAMGPARAAQQALKNNDPVTARRHLQEALVHDPHNPVLLAAMAEIDDKIRYPA